MPFDRYPFAVVIEPTKEYLIPVRCESNKWWYGPSPQALAAARFPSPAEADFEGRRFTRDNPALSYRVVDLSCS